MTSFERSLFWFSNNCFYFKIQTEDNEEPSDGEEDDDELDDDDEEDGSGDAVDDGGEDEDSTHAKYQKEKKNLVGKKNKKVGWTRQKKERI